jgi:hypothetical protein
MMEDSTCESFKPIKTLDLTHVPARVAKPEFFDSITYESPSSITEPETSLVPTSVNHNFTRFSQVSSRRKAISKQT